MNTTPTIDLPTSKEGTITLDGGRIPYCGVCGRPGPELVELTVGFDLYASRCGKHLEEPPNHKRERFYTARGTKPLHLTKEERKAAFAGTLKRLKRNVKPDQGSKEKVVLSWTRGGKQIVDYDTGATVYIPRQPRLWLVIKGWHLKAGSTEWETDVELVDRREQNRVLANGVGGLPRQAGLKTRWKESVDSEGKVSDRQVLGKEEQHEHWTPETERGYGGRSELERCDFNGSLVPSSGVDDDTLGRFSRVAEEESLKQRMKLRQAAKAAAREARSAEGRKRRLATAAKSRPLAVADTAATLNPSAEVV